MEIKWLSIALNDLKLIADFIKLDNPSAAKKIIHSIYGKLQLLTAQPHIGRPGRVKDTRELIIDGTPFIVPYRIKNNEVQILRVIHSSRKWPDNF